MIRPRAAPAMRRPLSPRGAKVPPMHYLFVTGKLAEPALRAVLEPLAPPGGFTYEVAVLNITVAALLTPAWVARHLQVPAGVERIMVPGACVGDWQVLATATGLPVERGP